MKIKARRTKTKNKLLVNLRNIETWGDEGYFFHASKEEILYKIREKREIKEQGSQPTLLDNKGLNRGVIAIIIGAIVLTGGGIGWYLWKRKK